MPKKVLIAFTPSLLLKIDELADKEHRTRSDLIREAMRSYIDKRELDKAKLTALKSGTVSLEALGND